MKVRELMRTVVSRQDLLRVFRLTDHEIHAEITSALRSQDHAPAGVRASVGVRHGVAAVVGSVARPEDVEAVASLIRSVDGVVDVDCDLAVREPGQDPMPARAKNS